MSHAEVVQVPVPTAQKIPVALNLFKAALFIALMAVSFYATNRLALALDAASAIPPAAAFTLKWGLVGFMGVVDVMLLIGIGVLAHDAVHRVLFPSAFWNELIGGTLSALAFIPFYANRQFHLTHHSYAHQPGFDPEDKQHGRPFWQAVSIGSVVALAEQYRLFLCGVLRIAEPRYTGRVFKDACFIAVTGGVYFVLLPQLGISLMVTVVPILVLFPLVFAFRALSDHYGLPAVKRGTKKRTDVLDANADTWNADHEQRQREVSGWVVLTSPWLEWLWSSVNYHEVHHKYPYLSYRYLRPVFEATQSQYPYRVVRGYWRSLLAQRKRSYYA